MDHQQKVLWSEGMFLTPHHFQQWDRHHEHLLQQRLRAVQPLGWGVCELRINEEALANGELLLSRCAAVLPDGTPVDVPDFDEAPKSRAAAAAFEAKKDALGVHLAVPRVKTGAAAVAADGDARVARYRQKFVTVADDGTGSNERQIAAGVKQLHLVFDGEPLDDFVALRIAELKRTATGGLALSETYVPPCLYLAGSPQLATVLRRILDMLSSKSTELARARRSRGQGLVEFTMSEAANFWFLHTVNSYIPALMHAYHRPQTHPEPVYLLLARLAGELITFAPEGHPKDLPPYAHDALGQTFGALEEKLRALMETVIPTRCVPIALEKMRESLYTGRIADEQMLERAQFYLAVMAGVPDEKIVREVPLKAKISSVDRVDRLVAQALRGVGLKHLPTPPTEIPVQPGRNYFQIQKGGEHWDAVRQSRTLSVYVPPEFTGLKLELMAVKE